MKISDRLFCFLLFDRVERNILITTPEFLKSLNIKKVDDIIIFNIPDNEIDIFRILSRFNKEENISKNFHIICDSDDLINKKEILANLN